MKSSFKLIIRVDWLTQAFMFLIALTGTIGAILVLIQIFQGSLSLVTFFFVLVFIAYFGWANALSTIQITNRDVTVNVFYGRFRICWDEIEKISTYGPYIALLGNDKRIVLSLVFAGQNSAKMLEFFMEQIEQRKIVFEQNVTPFPLTHQNARVWTK